VDVNIMFVPLGNENPTGSVITPGDAIEIVIWMGEKPTLALQ
jgi:hypothetical protein